MEKIHANLYIKALDALKANKPTPGIDYYVCKVCGNTVERQAPDKCLICGASQAQFLRVG